MVRIATRVLNNGQDPIHSSRINFRNEECRQKTQTEKKLRVDVTRKTAACPTIRVGRTAPRSHNDSTPSTSLHREPQDGVKRAEGDALNI